MDTYDGNFESYRNASLIEHADGLRYKKYMIIHGLSDTKVHFQHSAMLSKELQNKGIIFKQQVRPFSLSIFIFRHFYFRHYMKY